MKVKSMSEARFYEGTENYSGLCLECGKIQEDGVEPDAEGYTCPSCGSPSVCGFENALISGNIRLKE